MNKVRLFFVSICFPLIGVALQSFLVRMGLHTSLVPDLVFIFVLFLSFYELSVFGALLVFLVGLIVDLSGGMLLGPWAGAYIICFGMLSLVSDRIFVESPVSLFALTAAFVSVSHFLFLFIAFDPLGQLGTEWLNLFGKALCSAFFAPLVFSFLRRIFRGAKGDLPLSARTNYR